MKTGIIHKGRPLLEMEVLQQKCDVNVIRYRKTWMEIGGWTLKKKAEVINE